MSSLKSLIKILSLLVILVPSVGRTENWKSMGSTPVAKFYHDADQLVGEQENRKLVVKVNYAVETKDGTRSALQEIFVNCIDRTYSIGIVKRYSLGDLQGSEKTTAATGRKQSPVQGSPGEDYIKRACESPPKSSSVNNNSNATATTSNMNQRTFKFIPTLSPEDINILVIKKGINEVDLDVFLTMYGFIWSLNNWLSDTPVPGSTSWMNGRTEQHNKLIKYRGNAKFTLVKFEETISKLAGNLGLTSAQFKQAIGIVEISVPPVCNTCGPGYKTLKTKRAGLIDELLNRNDITSDGVGMGVRAFYEYTNVPGLESVKNNKGHPGLELTPVALFDFYSKWIPNYYLEQTRLARLQTAAGSTEERLEKQQLDAELARANRQEEERKRQEFLSSPEGKRQIAKEQENERLRQKQFAQAFPFYAVVSCSGSFPVHACFSGRVNTELELRNGNEYKMYSNVDVMQIPQNQSGISFDLRNKFEIKMQNSSDTLMLNLKVYSRATNQIVFEKSAARFGVIRASN